MSRSVRVVLSAANPGAAALILNTLDVFSCCSGIEVIGVLVQPPADKILSPRCTELGVPCYVVAEPRFSSRDDMAAQTLLGRLEELVMPLAPDSVVTGLSGPDFGVDEALLHLARGNGWLSYSLQDSPGWVVFGLSGPARTYFVQNSSYVHQTESTPGVHRAVSVGSLKLLTFSAEAKERASSAVERPGVTFLGQPLWHLPGYETALRNLADILDQAGIGPLVYRPHPLEDNAAVSKVVSKKLLREVNSVSYEETLLSRNALVTCFSTGLQDAAQLAALTNRACPRLIYYLDQDDIRDEFISASQPLQQTIDQQPYAQFILTPPTTETLCRMLESGPEQSPNFEAAEPERIVQTILKDCLAKHFLPQSYAAHTGLNKSEAQESVIESSVFEADIGLAEILESVGPRVAPLRLVTPSQGGNHYMRTELAQHGVVFMKTINADQRGRLETTMRLEAALAQHCPHVVAPIIPSPAPLANSDRFVAIWPWLDARPINPFDHGELYAAGTALGCLHQELGRIDFPMDYARDRVEWLLQSWQDLLQNAENNQLESFNYRFPWLKDALQNVSRGISERFLAAPRQLVHGDLNPGNLMCMPGPVVMFIDFEESVQSFLPTFFDLATLIERHLMTGAVDVCWQHGATKVMEGYIDQTGIRLPYAECFFDARCFSILRSLSILVASERVGRPWPESEWQKFDKLTRYVLEQEHEMSNFAKAFL